MTIQEERLRLALERIMANPYGCPFCDSGKLRMRVDKKPPFHAPDCEYLRAQEALDSLPATSDTMPYVRAFGDRMEEKLAENRHKGDRPGWLRMTPSTLFAMLLGEVRELHEALDGEPREITRECADVANLSMMLADVAGDLEVGQ